MREIDEVAKASTDGDEGSSSPAVAILPSDPRARTSSPAPHPRSPPPSFEDFTKETVIATLAEGVRCSGTSPAHPDPLPRPAEGPAAQLESTSSKRKGKEVAPVADEGPVHKKLHADRDSEFMVSRILAMAKAFAPPRSHTLSTVAPSLGPDAPVHSQGPPVVPSEPGPTLVTNSVGEREVPPGKLQISHSLEEEQDNFSLEFARLQEKVASDREALERGSPASSFPPGPGSPIPGAASVAPGASTSFPPSPPLRPDTGRISRLRG